MTIIKSPRLGQFKVKQVAMAAIKSAGRHLHDHFIPNHRNNYHPHVLGHRALALFSALLVSVKIFSLSLLAFGPALPAFSSAITSSNIISLTNASRKVYGLSALTENPLLAKAAQAKADDMLSKGYFSHNTPDGRTPWTFIEDAGYNYLMAGENLAVNFTEAENVEDAWMNSPGHKANILNKNFEEIGIGISQGQYQGHNAIFVVQMFGTPAEQKITLTDVPTPVATGQSEPSLGEEVAAESESPVLAIATASAKLENGQIKVQAQTTPGAVKVTANFGQRAVMLYPRSDQLWEGNVSLAELTENYTTIKIRAYDINGQEAKYDLADFSGNTMQNYNILGATSEVKANLFGHMFDPKSFEQKFFLFFVAGIAASLALAIAIKRHIQHVMLVANGSFVAIFAMLLWLAG